LFDVLHPLIRDAKGLVLSFSHTPYTEETAGTELFIGDEQHLFNARGFVYLHFSPLAWSRFMIDSPPEKTVDWIIVDGKKVGAAPVEEIAHALIASGCARTPKRIMVIHSPLGQSKSGFLRILEAVNPTETYYWLHDYSSVCTGYNLLRNNVAFCSGPPQDSVACTVCVFGASRPEHTALLRQTFDAANFTVVAPSEVARDTWSRASTLPHRDIIVKEHCRLDYSAGLHREPRPAKPLGTEGHPIRVAFVGFGAMHKGWPTFERVVDETRGDAAYEYFQFAKKGLATRSRRIQIVDAVVTTANRDAMAELLSRHEIDIVVSAAIWPETFSYVTFEALAAGCDVVTVACSGNIASQVRRTGRGRVFETEDELVNFFTGHGAVELVRSRAQKPNPRGSLSHIGTTAAIVFDGVR
jgi:glycosyltransferase involved in cell wall biosynthesis